MGALIRRCMLCSSRWVIPGLAAGVTGWSAGRGHPTGPARAGGPDALAAWSGVGQVSPLAADALGTQPVPWRASPVWTLASGVLPIMIALACAFTVMPLAAG